MIRDILISTYDFFILKKSRNLRPHVHAKHGVVKAIYFRQKHWGEKSSATLFPSSRIRSK